MLLICYYRSRGYNKEQQEPMQGQDQSKVTIDATEKSTDEAERVSIHEGDVGERADKSAVAAINRALRFPRRDRDPAETVQPAKPVLAPTPAVGAREFDWFAIGVVILIAALFALAARLSPQPATSLAPAAVLSATGCGLLVTALRKLHTSSRPGLFEAAVGGLFLALFQFMAAITYPNVVYALSLAYDERLGFLTTWALIAAFSIIFSILGATLGHLAFAPLRPLPTRTNTLQPLPADAGREEPVPPARSQHSLVSYLISVLLLGLAPTLVAYVFSAAFDYMLRANLFFPGPYPTLRLLS